MANSLITTLEYVRYTLHINIAHSNHKYIFKTNNTPVNPFVYSMHKLLFNEQNACSV